MANKLLWGLGGLAVVLLGAAVLMGGDDDPAQGSGSGSGGKDNGNGSVSLEEKAQLLRSTYLDVDLNSCEIQWKDAAAKAALPSHVSDFFAPAVRRARESGATTVDAITIAVAQLLVPGCPQPPPPLVGVDIDRALAGTLPMGPQQGFYALQGFGPVQFYLAVRNVVSALVAASGGA